MAGDAGKLIIKNFYWLHCDHDMRIAVSTIFMHYYGIFKPLLLPIIYLSSYLIILVE